MDPAPLAIFLSVIGLLLGAYALGYHFGRGSVMVKLTPELVRLVIKVLQEMERDGKITYTIKDGVPAVKLKEER